MNRRQAETSDRDGRLGAGPKYGRKQLRISPAKTTNPSSLGSEKGFASTGLSRVDQATRRRASKGMTANASKEMLAGSGTTVTVAVPAARSPFPPKKVLSVIKTVWNAPVAVLMLPYCPVAVSKP